MKGVLTLILLWITNTSCQFEIGDPCNHNTQSGVCTPLEECLIVQRMIDQGQKPTFCSFRGPIRVVCCTEENVKSETTTITTTESISNNFGTENDTVVAPADMNYLEALQSGIFRSNVTVCRFDGNYPMKCYRQEYPRYTMDPKRDPENCKINYPNVSVSSHLQVVWEACRNYTLKDSLCYPANTPGDYIRDTYVFMLIHVDNGNLAQITDFPHMAVLGTEDTTVTSKKTKPIIWYGAGSLISEYFILTAGHVINFHNSFVKYALLGSANKTDFKSGVMFQIVRVIGYPEYNPLTKHNDIAVLEVDRRVRFSEYIRPICLNMVGIQTEAGRTIAGWGKVGIKQHDSPILLTAEVMEKQHKICKKNLGSKRLTYDPETMLCAGPDSTSGKSSDTCQGDSGGPLMANVRDLTGSSVVIGVVSAGPVCGKGKPGYYTRVSNEKYLEWITGIVWP